MSKERKRLVIALTIVLLSIILMTYQYSLVGNINMRFLSYPYDLLKSATFGLRSAVGDFFSVYRDNVRLKEQVASLMTERQQYGSIIEENKRLRELLDFKPQGFKVIAYSRIIGRGYDRVLEIVVIDKGESTGIKKGMAVITTRGLLGKIYRVYDSYSEVLLLRDPNFSVAVRIQESRVEGVLSGTGYGYASLNYIPPEEQVEKGDTIVSSGLDGIFPTGIPIGVVSAVNKDNVEFFQQIKVTPFQQDTKAEEAMVLAGLKDR